MKGFYLKIEVDGNGKTKILIRRESTGEKAEITCDDIETTLAFYEEFSKFTKNLKAKS